MNQNQKTSTATLSVLFLSSLGTCLFMAGIVLFLLELGFSAATTSTAVALTAIPNVFFGQILGRWVDRSSKTKLFVGLSLYLAAVELFLLKAAGWWGGSSSTFAVIALMLAFSFGYSPLMTLIYSYLIPSLDEDESRIFTQWEKANSWAAVLGGVIGFALLNRLSAGWLIILDVVTFVLAAAFIPMIWKNPNTVVEALPAETAASPKTSSSNLIRSLLKDRPLVATAATMWVLALSLTSVENNNLAIGWLELKLGASYSALSTCLFAAMSLAGSHWFSANAEWLKLDLMKTQRGTLMVGASVLATMLLGSLFKVPALGFLSLLAISFLEPTTSVTTNLLIRSRVDMQRIGEVYGLIRMPRALLTIFGTSLIGWSHDYQIFPIVTMGGVFVLIGAALANQWAMRESTVSQSVEKVA